MFSRSATCLSFVGTMILVGCATALPGYSAVALTPAGRNVQLMKADPPPGCAEVGPVRGEGDGAEFSKNDARNKAAEAGANYVRMESVTAHAGWLTGTAYRCPNASSASDAGKP
jgi:hypothetical protein